MADAGPQSSSEGVHSMFGESSFPFSAVLTKERIAKGFLSEWVKVTNGFQATDPRDNIYGILEMTSSRDFRIIEPDYSKTVVGVYCRVTAHVILSGDLSCIQVDQDDKRLGGRSVAPPLRIWRLHIITEPELKYENEGVVR